MATKVKTQVTAAKTGQNAVTKISTVIDLLKQSGGATLDEIVKATGWQPHSARAALTGLRKKGHTIEKSKPGDQTCYHITASA
jgi:DNA-binding IclR family transcriptional regulator